MSRSADPATVPYLSPLSKALVRHSHFDQAEAALLESLADPNGAPVPFLIGASGFGKSRLLELVSNQVAWGYRDAMAADPNLRPVVGFEALAPLRGNFDLRLGFLRILSDLGERGVELRIGRPLDPDWALERLALGQRPRELGLLQLDLIDALKHHGTHALFIDEVGHLAYVNDVARYQSTLDIIKSIANETGCRIVCAGSYDAAGFRSVSGQLIRRQGEIHLRRYRADVPVQYTEYGRVVAEMLGIIGFDGDPGSLVETLYRTSVGTVGTTRDVLVRADHAAHWFNETLVHGLARTLRPDDATQAFARQIVAGESAFDRPVRSELDELIGLTGVAPLQIAPVGKRRSTKAAKTAQRALQRDLVGASRAS